jgi:vacuolar protein sorting-associated protein 3
LQVAEYAKDLISIYLDELLSTLKNDQDTRDVLEASYLSYRALEAPKPTYRVFIEENSSGNLWWSTRLRFLDLLAEESSYEVEELLERLNPWQKLLVAELVIIYGKDSRHSEALKLLCHELGDFDTAVNYCLFGAVSIFKTERTIKTKEEQSELFKLLLIEFLALEDAEASVKQTCSLLRRFGSWLNVEDVSPTNPLMIAPLTHEGS